MLFVFSMLKLTGVDFIQILVVFERFIVKPEIDVDRAVGSLLVEPVRPQNVLQPEQVHVWAESHLSHAVRVEVELILNDLAKVLKCKWKM